MIGGNRSQNEVQIERVNKKYLYAGGGRQYWGALLCSGVRRVQPPGDELQAMLLGNQWKKKKEKEWKGGFAHAARAIITKGWNRLEAIHSYSPLEPRHTAVSFFFFSFFFYIISLVLLQLQFPYGVHSIHTHMDATIWIIYKGTHVNIHPSFIYFFG